MSGGCGEKVAHYSSVVEKKVPEEMASGTYIRWLVASEDGAKNYYMRLFRMEPGAHIKPHFHPWEHEIYILSGKGSIRIGPTTYTVGEGYFLYIPPNVEHEYRAGPEGMSFLCIIPSGPTAEKTDKPIECGDGRSEQ